MFLGRSVTALGAAAHRERSLWCALPVRVAVVVPAQRLRQLFRGVASAEGTPLTLSAAKLKPGRFVPVTCRMQLISLWRVDMPSVQSDLSLFVNEQRVTQHMDVACAIQPAGPWL